jgi:hypothetical protein
MSGTAELAVYATDSQRMTAEDLFSVTFGPSPSGHSGLANANFAGAVQVDPSHVAALLTIHT